MKSIKFIAIMLLGSSAAGLATGISDKNCTYTTPGVFLPIGIIRDCNNATKKPDSGNQGHYKAFGDCGTNPNTGGLCGSGIQSGGE